MLTAAQYQFAAGLASGLSATDAYAAAFPKSKHPRNDAARLLSPKCRARGAIQEEVARIRREAEQLAGGAVLSLAEKRMFLARLVRCSIGSLPDDSDLLEEVTRGSEGEIRRVFDKLQAIELDNLLAGHGAAARVLAAGIPA
ncbi:MAG: Terminase small subunit [Verrucomicrobiales bacterium]|nr:Terminase small subunit [Verrucomicrobiales bacterium]